MNIAIILAAGEGTRMKSKLPKVLHKICGKELIKYVIDASKNSGVEKNIIILGHGKEKVIEALKGTNTIMEVQPIGADYPYGTGFAVMQGEKHFEDEDTVLILNGDVPLIESETLSKFIEYHKEGDYAVSILTADFENPDGYGRIVRNSNGQVISIVEQKDANIKEKRIKEINSGIYCFKGKNLIDTLKKLDTNNSQKEYYITDAVKILNSQEYGIGGFKIEDIMEISGVNNKYQLTELNLYMKDIINKKHMMNGVTIIDPLNTYIEETVIIDRDVVIKPGTHLEGNTLISEDCIIGPDTTIINSKIGFNTTIEYSKLIDSIVGNHTAVGPYAFLRPGTELGNHVKIGDFVEVKNTKIGDGSKASHLSYLGDGEVGKNVNVGCGVIFVNYNGKIKSKTIIKDDAFIGSNSNLIAPVTIEEGAYVASGSTITDNVEKNSLAIARARQVNKLDRGKNKYK